MKLSWETVGVHTSTPFVIARGGASEHTVLIVRVVDADGREGFGEAAPNRFYGETPVSAVGALERLRPIVEGVDPFRAELLEAQMNATIRGNGSVKSAVSAAVHDLVAKRLGIPLHALWGIDPDAAPKSSYTVSIAATTEELTARVRAAAEYPILKIKLGTDRDETIIRAVRDAAPMHTIRVDANAAWSPRQAVRMSHLLAELGVEFLEQPVAANDIEGLRFIRERSPIPVIADESCVVASDIPRLAGAVDGINIKLSKCGGLRQALAMIATARAHSMSVMLGCMIETSLGISTAAQLAGAVDYADLDGAALLSDDPFIGATIDRGVISVPTAPGIGVARRPRS